MQKIIVTGGAGFIGSHLIEHLLKNKKCQILVIDDFSEGKLSNLPQTARLVICRSSILDDSIGKWGIFKSADLVFHLAALTRPRWSIRYPTETNRVNVEGTLKVLEHCVNGKIGKLIYVSSASVYGKQKKLLLTEDMKPSPMSPYAVTKQAGESYCQLFSELYGLKYDIVRPFNVYGVRQSLYGEYSAAVSNFINYLQSNKKPYITGNGKQVRDFVYIKDVVELMVLLGKRKGIGEVFNCGSGKETSVNDLFKLISKLMGKKGKPKYIKKVDDPDTKANMRKVIKFLNWKPSYSLEEGLSEMIGKTK